MSTLLNRLQALADAPPEDPVGASIDLLLLALGAESARHLELAAIPHYFDAVILRVLDPDLGLVEAHSRCEQLQRLSIVLERDSHLVFHDEARRYLFQRWLLPERAMFFREASRRLTEYYSKPDPTATATIQDAFRRSKMFHLLGSNQDQGFEWFETLWAEAREASRHHECRHLINLVCEYRTVLSPEKLLWLTLYESKLAADLRHFDEGERSLRSILGAPACTPKLRVQALMGLGIVFQAQRRWPEAIRRYNQALAFARATPDLRDDIQCLLALGVVYRENGSLTEAEKYVLQAVSIASNEGDTELLSAALNSLGALHLRRGDSRRAIVAFEKSLLQANDRHVDRIYHNLGSAYAASAAWEQSENFFIKSLEMKERHEDVRGQALTLNNLVQVHSCQGRFEKAAEAAWRAVDLLSTVHDFQGAGRAARNLARLYRKSGDLEQAESGLRKAAELFQRDGDEARVVVIQEEIAALRKTVKVPMIAWIVLGVVALVLVAGSFLIFVAVLGAFLGGG